ncbi:type VI secretion system baseplate subunit TssK [Zooshikella ganghwensis]|uniref:Type VI secretion system baseplate subunit TssK n=1 Tax=Zooshikella ganghwensis TaxID=202772 RepID=A0A4P9VKE7_9GAMM|nr:type VI secretion system baseplate subunit TssK [Zooshikella ganghwensis]RDH42824.1 hypothetical protein B9G39_04810 [Zooshikella ganghwensis]
MANDVPAPVKWELGQPLLPEHLMAQEESLIAEASERLTIMGLPAYGLSVVQWDEALLRDEGCLQLKKLRLLTKNYNVFVDYPGNTRILTPPIALQEHREPTIYYYILREKAPKYDSTVTPLIPKNEGINRRLLKLIISASQVLPSEYEYLLNDHDFIEQGCLGQFEKPYDKGWQLSNAFVPPLLQLGQSPYLTHSLKQLLSILRRYRAELRQEYTAKNLPTSLLYGVKQCLHSVQTNLRLLENLNVATDIEGELKLHPYYLYDSLQGLLTDITLYRGEWPERDPKPYRHQQLHMLFSQLIQQLVVRMKVNKEQAQCYEFMLKDGLYSTPLPPGINTDDTLYLVIDHQHHAPLTQDELPRITSCARVSTLHNYSLKGVDLIPIENPTFGYEFGQSVQCFKLSSEGERLHIQKSNDVGFYAQSLYQTLSFYLYRKLPFETVKTMD